jgi:hypothetical protein
MDHVRSRGYLEMVVIASDVAAFAGIAIYTQVYHLRMSRLRQNSDFRELCFAVTFGIRLWAGVERAGPAEAVT